MKKWENLLKELGYFNLVLLIICLLVSVISYFATFSSKVITIILMLFVLFVFGVFGYRAGRKVEAKGFIAGLKIGAIEILVMFIIGSVAFGWSFNLSKIFYYLVLILGSVTGSMIGINKR